MYEIILRKGIIALSKATRFLGILLALAIMAGALAVPAAAVYLSCEECEEYCMYYCSYYCYCEEDDYICEECEEYCLYYCSYDCDCDWESEGAHEGGEENEAPKTFWQRVWAFIQFFLDGISLSYEVNRKMDWEFLDVFSSWFDNSHGFEFSGSGLIDFLLRFRELFG